MKKEKLILEFYRRAMFGKQFDPLLTLDNCIKMSVNQAYRDLSRTLNGIGKYKNKKEKAAEFLTDKFVEYFNADSKAEKAFDEWHRQICELLVDIYKGYTRKSKSFGFTVGNAQKWLNMTFKYLYTFTLDNSFGKRDAEEYFKHCHLALDSYTLKWFKEKVDAKNLILQQRWSLINNYSTYLNAQNKAREYVKQKHNTTLFLKEFKIWEQYR